MTALLAAGARDADAVPGAGVRGVGAVPVLRRSQGGAARSRSARAGASSCRSFRALARSAGRRRCRPGRPGRRSRGASCDLAERERHADCAATCTAICSRCGARIRSSAAAAGSVDGAVRRPRRRSCCAISAAIGRRSAADRQPRARPSCSSPVPEPLLAPPFGSRTGKCAGRASRPATAAPGTPPLVLTARCACRRSRPCPRDRRAAPRRGGDAKSTEDTSDERRTPSRRSVILDDSLDGDDPHASPRMARHERPGRLRLRHRRRRRHAPLSRPAGRRAAGAARPRGDAEPPARARPPAGRQVLWLGDEERRRAARTPSIASEHLVEFRLEAGLPVWRYDVRGHRRSRSAC